MALNSPIWPNLEALFELWETDIGAQFEQSKALQLNAVSKGHIPARPKILVIGPVSESVVSALYTLQPTRLFIAHPPAIGVWSKGVGQGRASILIDTDLPPFAHGYFDLVILSYVLEYQSNPLPLLSLVYEIIQSQGRLISFVPHRFQSQTLRIGYGTSYFDLGMRNLFKQAAFTPHRGQWLRTGKFRPQGLIHLAQPQVPPKFGGRFEPSLLIPALLRPKRIPGIAASDQRGVGKAYE